MTSKIYKVLFIVLLAAFQFSCSEFLKGKPKKQDTIEVTKDSLSCLKDVTHKWKTFLKSETSDKEIEDVFSCLDSTLNEFQNRIEGRADAQSFTSEELFQIFDKFIKDAQVSQDAAKDLLVLKTGILGGAPDKITKKEISDLRAYLLLVKAEAKALLPYAQLFKFSKAGTSQFSKKMLDEGFGQLNLSLKNLFKASKLNHSEYQFSDLQRLITNLKIVDQQQDDLLMLANKVKDLLIGQQSLLGEGDYLAFIDNLTEVLRLYSFHLQGYVKFSLQNPEELNDAIEYGQNWINLLENSIQFKRNKIVSVETLDPLIKEIADRGLIPISVKSETLLNFYKILIMRAFDSGVSGDLNSFLGLTKMHFANIKREISILKLQFQFISEAANPAQLKAIGKERISVAQLQDKLKEFKPNQLAWLAKLDEPMRKSVLIAFEEFKTEMLGPRPVIYRFKKMVIAVNQEIWDQNWQDLAQAAYVKILSRELLLGWGNAFNSKQIINASLSEAQLIQWYSEFKQFGIETKTFDKRSENSGAVSFKQANLLTYAADGDAKMNYLETVQFLNMLVAGGGQTLREIQEGAMKAKCGLSDNDSFGHPWLSETCVMTDLRMNFKYYFSNLSYLVAFTSKLDDRQFMDFYMAVMDVTRVDAKLKGQRLETADLRSMSILFHYIESLYARYDADNNFTFSAAEIRSAYPRFKNFAKQYAYDNAKPQIDKFNGVLAQSIGGYGCFSEEDLIRESFVFLVYNGKAPSQSDLNTLPCFRNKPLIDFSGEVDRKQIINTFKILKSVLGS